ncbi:hypothetical protein DB347_02695 [Opitutaceae bacterium EW11]|nr:hypothetical protein DB347_02695 [Opitutaceae bacterium EW11]
MNPEEDVPTTNRNFLPRPSHDDIAFRAHKLWCERGCPPGSEMQDWLEAERQLLIERGYRKPDHPLKEDTIIPRGTMYDAFAEEAPLAVKTEERLEETSGRAESRNSPTSFEL